MKGNNLRDCEKACRSCELNLPPYRPGLALLASIAQGAAIQSLMFRAAPPPDNY